VNGCVEAHDRVRMRQHTYLVELKRIEWIITAVWGDTCRLMTCR
jgi:hypothetical protein